jgi:5-formyltetrahydrofolate cyclo-ligase
LRHVPKDVQAAKAQLRQQLLERLHHQSVAERQQRSRQITAQILASTEFQQARTIMAYAALPYEVDTAAIIDQALALGKRVVLPRVDQASQRMTAHTITNRSTDVEQGPFHIQQPTREQATVRADAIDVVLVPGVGFDRSGHRLGHGQGYYDRWLATLPDATARIGLAFACQVVEQVPVGDADVRMTRVERA